MKVPVITLLASLACLGGSQTLGFIVQGPKLPIVNRISESKTGEYYLKNLIRYTPTGLPLGSQPYYYQTFARSVVPLANGDYATTGSGEVVVRRADGSIRHIIQVNFSSGQTYEVTEVGGNLYVLFKTNQQVRVAKYSKYGVAQWYGTPPSIDLTFAHSDPESFLFQGTDKGLFIAGKTATGYSVARMDLADGSIDARVDKTLVGDELRFARNGDRVAILQRRGSTVDIAGFDAGTAGATIPEAWRTNAEDPYLGTTGTFRMCLVPATGSGFLYSYRDENGVAVSKQVVQELDANGMVRWTSFEDCPSTNENIGYRALVTDGTYAYATGSIKTKTGAILYDRFLLTVWRRSDGLEVGRTEQGYHSPLLSGVDICLDNQGAIGIALEHTTNLSERYLLAKYFFAPPIGVTGVSLVRFTLAGENRTLGTVTLDRPAIRGSVSVTLESSDPVVTVPSVIEVPEGSATKSFPVSVTPVPAARVETITARAGTTSASVAITVVPLAPSAFAFTPSPVTGGSTVSARLVINGVAGPGGHSIDLSDDSPFATTPASTVVPAAGTQAVFDIATLPTAVTRYVTVTATTPGGSKTGLFIIQP